MKCIHSIALFLGLSLSATTPAINPTPHGKPKAPVVVSIQCAPGTVSVRILFEADVDGASVSAWGLDGLTVSQVSPLDRTSFRKGEATTLKVSYVPGSGASTLAVHVGGSFNGQKQKTVQTFSMEPSIRAARDRSTTRATPGNVIMTSEGQALLLLPATPE